MKSTKLLKIFFKNSLVNSKRSLDILNTVTKTLEIWIVDGLRGKSKELRNLEATIGILQLYIFNQLVQNNTKIDEIDKKFDTLIKQNEELNQKFDKLIDLFSKE